MASRRGGRSRPQGDQEGSILEGSWLWIALPVGVLALIAALWYLVIAPGAEPAPPPTATPGPGAAVEATLTPLPPMNVSTAVPASAESTAAAMSAPTAAARPATVQVGARVQVTGTNGAGLRLRQSPSTDSVTLQFASDGAQFVVVDGPQQADDITWWKIDDQNGLVGWASGDYLKVVP